MQKSRRPPQRGRDQDQGPPSQRQRPADRPSRADKRSGSDAGTKHAGAKPHAGARPNARHKARFGAAPVDTGAPSGPMRIAKAVARAGLCSRRDAERWIAEGRISVNGKVLSSPALDVGPTDRILVDGQPLPTAEPPKLWRYYKPRGLVTTHKDPEGRPTVFEKLPPELGRVISIGRLDFNTEGLLLLTNDGALARHMELPATGWLRRYRVRAFGRVTQAGLDTLKEGTEIEGVRYGPIDATLDKEQGHNIWLTIGLREGKNREVRTILGSLGLEVNRLIRISFGPFQLLDLEPGAIENVKRRVLIDQLGARLAADLGLTEASDESTAAPGKRPKRKPAQAGAKDGKDAQE